MKKKLLFILMASVLMVSSVLCLIKSNDTASATSVKTLEYSDNFNNSSLSDMWTVNNAQSGKDYNALSLINWNLWQPSVNLTTMPVEAGNDHATLTFDVSMLSG